MSVVRSNESLTAAGSYPTCPACSGAYDGAGVRIGDEITCPHCGHVFAHTLLFGNYRLERKLGSGGMGVVYLAKDEMLARSVAVKILNRRLSQDANFVATFLREAETTAKLSHPNIVQVFAFGENQGQYYLVMECLPGGSFDDLIVKHGKLPELQCLDIGIGAAQGLDYAAKRGLVHRDVKPGNILIDANGIPKVVDFGLAQQTANNTFDPADVTTEDGQLEVWGTPYYLPPERLFGLPEDFRSDQYALAASLFHALAGRAPYEDKDPARIALRHREGSPVRIQMFNPDLSEKTCYAIDRAMSRDPKARFQNYEEFLAHLVHARQELQCCGGKAVRDHTVEVLEERSDRTKALLIVVSIIVVLLLTVGGFFMWQHVQDNKAKASAQDEFLLNAPTPQNTRQK